MSKLTEIMFKEMTTKEVLVKGHKVVLKPLTTQDNIELDINIETETTGTKSLLQMSLKILSRSIVSVDGVSPDSPEETIQFLQKQDTGIVFSILGEYQKIAADTVEEIKN